MAYYNQFNRLAKQHEKIAKANFLIVVKGYSVKQAAKEIGVCRKTVSRWIKSNYFTVQKSALHEDKKPVAKFLLDRGYSKHEVATLLTVSNTTIANWVKTYEWDLTPPQNIDFGGDITLLSWKFLQFIRANDPAIYLNVIELIKSYRGTENSIGISST